MTTSVEHLARLIAFPTVSRDSNRALIDHIAGVLAPLGAAIRVVPSQDGTKANLYATIGPADKPGVVLSGHTDVVPVDGQDWTGDPFRLHQIDGRLVGRGTADMKGFIACCLAAAPTAAAASLRMPVHFAFSYDEEVGCLGVRRLLDVLAEIEPKPRFCIVGEPTSLQVVTAHKGKLGTEVIATGREAHSALAPQAVNAIHLVIDLIQEIRAIQAEIAAGDRQDPAYEVPYTTLHVGRISGGETINIVPNHARFAFEIRYVPGDDPERLMALIRGKAEQIAAAARARHSGAGFVFKPLQSYPPLDTPPDSEVVSFVQRLAQTNSTGKISFGTEGGLFHQRLGVPTVVCGPGSIAVAHKPDEYIELSQLEACDRFLERLIAALSR